MLTDTVKRASRVAGYEDDGILTGFEIGHGNLRVRFYDKPLEITKKSKKTWMYDIWGVKEVPPGCRIIRVEFQIRREALVELGVDTVWQLTNYARNLWAYCTQKWIKFQDDPKVHHTQQETLLWWKTVQNGFLGGQRECPLIRAKIVNAKKAQLAAQMMGQLTSLVAMDSDGDITPGGEVTIEEQLSKVIESAELIGMDPHKFYDRVCRKAAKYLLDIEKFRNAERERKALGLPVMRPDGGNGGGK